jgi:hypothetical protein
MRLDRITDRTAWSVFAAGLAASVLAAAFAPREVELGAWVRLVIWHGMLKWACILVIFAMGAVASRYLASKRRALYDWMRALQITTLMVWVFAVMVGAASAKLIWGDWNLTERRMTMSLVYIMIAAAGLIVGLVLDKPRLTAALAVLTSLSMAALLAWIELAPVKDDIHPANAVMSSDDVMFKVFAMAMLAGCLVWVLALVVPTRRWVERHAGEEAPLGAGPGA